MQACQLAAFSALAGNLLMAGQACAATEVATLASDNRFGSLFLLFVPVIGWVLFNILGPSIPFLIVCRAHRLLLERLLGLVPYPFALRALFMPRTRLHPAYYLN